MTKARAAEAAVREEYETKLERALIRVQDLKREVDEGKTAREEAISRSRDAVAALEAAENRIAANAAEVAALEAAVQAANERTVSAEADLQAARVALERARTGGQVTEGQWREREEALQAQIAEMEAAQAASERDLQRLREHLLETEDQVGCRRWGVACEWRVSGV